MSPSTGMLSLERILILIQPNDSTQLSLLDICLSNEDEPFDHFQFQKPSTWNPNGPIHLESFVIVNEQMLNDYTFPVISQHNLCYKERHVLAELKKAHEITIKPADKGSAVVIQNLNDYITEGLRRT